MKVKCLNCGSEFDLWRLEHDENNPEGFYTSCMECGASFDIDEKEILDKLFITDICKMADFKILSRKYFIKHYNITEDEYDATALYYKWLYANDSEP